MISSHDWNWKSMALPHFPPGNHSVNFYPSLSFIIYFVPLPTFSNLLMWGARTGQIHLLATGCTSPSLVYPVSCMFFNVSHKLSDLCFYCFSIKYCPSVCVVCNIIACVLWLLPIGIIQLKSEVYIHLGQIHLNSVFHNSWHLILVKIPCLRSVRIITFILRMWNIRIVEWMIYFSFYFFHHIPSGSEVYIHWISIW